MNDFLVLLAFLLFFVIVLTLKILIEVLPAIPVISYKRYRRLREELSKTPDGKHMLELLTSTHRKTYCAEIILYCKYHFRSNHYVFSRNFRDHDAELYKNVTKELHDCDYELLDDFYTVIIREANGKYIRNHLMDVYHDDDIVEILDKERD